MSHHCHYGKYALTYRLARGVDLNTRYGRFVAKFVIYSFSACVLVLAAAALIAIVAIILSHFFGISEVHIPQGQP